MKLLEILMTIEEFFDALPEMTVEQRLADNRRALRSFRGIVETSGWTTVQYIVVEYACAAETEYFVRLLLLHLQSFGVLFDAELLDAADWDRPGKELPDSAKLWTGDPARARITLDIP